MRGRVVSLQLLSIVASGSLAQATLPPIASPSWTNCQFHSALISWVHNTTIFDGQATATASERDACGDAMLPHGIHQSVRQRCLGPTATYPWQDLSSQCQLWSCLRTSLPSSLLGESRHHGLLKMTIGPIKIQKQKQQCLPTIHELWRRISHRQRPCVLSPYTSTALVVSEHSTADSPLRPGESHET